MPGARIKLSDTNNSLRDAVEALYAQFLPYRLGDDFVGCDCCVSPSRSAALAAKPLRSLTYDDLATYAFKAMSTWGDERHFKHFLPRIFELTVEHRDEFVDLAVVFGKLSYADWRSWPRREVDAVASFLKAYWEYQLGLDVNDPHDNAIDTVLCAEANAFDSVQPLLDVWLATDLLSARKHLAAFVLLNGDDLILKRRLWNSFWSRDSNPCREVISWLQSDKPSSYLRGMKLTGDFGLAACLLDAIRAAAGPRSA